MWRKYPLVDHFLFSCLYDDWYWYYKETSDFDQFLKLMVSANNFKFGRQNSQAPMPLFVSHSASEVRDQCLLLFACDNNLDNNLPFYYLPSDVSGRYYRGTASRRLAYSCYAWKHLQIRQVILCTYWPSERLLGLIFQMDNLITLLASLPSCYILLVLIKYFHCAIQWEEVVGERLSLVPWTWSDHSNVFLDETAC